MTSFQAKICLKRLRMRENKNYRSVSFLPDGQGKIPKKQQKIEKYHFFFIPRKNRLENAENGENKNYRYVLFLPDRQEKIPKKIEKTLKKLKNTITDSSQAKIGGKMLRKRENKNYHSVSFLPDGKGKFQKNSKKN